MNLFCVIPYACSDANLVQTLLEWMHELGGSKTHDCLLVPAFHVPEDVRTYINGTATLSFKSVSETSPEAPLPNEQWPLGANQLFLTASSWMEKKGQTSWLLVEPDCVPLRRGWLESINDEYAECDELFMGVIMDATKVGDRQFPRTMAGIGAYPPDTASRFASLDLENAKEAWDILTGDIAVPFTHATRQIVHVWGTRNEPPVFVQARQKGDPKNHMTLDQIPRDCCLFHRVKGSSLIDLLRNGGTRRFAHETLPRQRTASVK